MTRRRPAQVALDHPEHGLVVINDNASLHEGKLARCLDDGLTPAQWLEALNARVFFFTRVQTMDRLRGASLNRAKPKDVLVVDTARLAEAYGSVMEICPINSGNTNHQPARRGHATFAPLLTTDFDEWRRRRGKKAPDTIKEVVVRGSVPDLSAYVVEVREGAPAS